jgi:hypothetical protein
MNPLSPSLKVPELREMATARGINAAKLKKQELIDAITAHMAAEEEAAPVSDPPRGKARTMRTCGCDVAGAVGQLEAAEAASALL